MIWRRSQRNTGKNKDRPERTSLMSVSTGLTDVTVSFWAIVQCHKWARVHQSIHLTTNAKPTRTARSVSVKNMVINVLASLFDTPGDMPPNDPPLNHQMMLVRVNVNSSSVIFSSSRTLLPTKTSTMRTTTLSTLQSDSIMKTKVSVQQVVILQLNTNAVVVSMHHGTGSQSTTTNAAINRLHHLALLLALTMSAKNSIKI